MPAPGKLSDSIKTLVYRVLWIAGAIGLTHHIGGNPLDEFALIRRAHVAVGSLLETIEDEQGDHRGRVYFSYVGVYTFRTPAGQQFKASTRVPSGGQLNEQQDVEYLPDRPAVNRIRGDGSASIHEWLGKLGVGTIFLALLLSPGICLLRAGINEIRQRQQIPDERNA